MILFCKWCYWSCLQPGNIEFPGRGKRSLEMKIKKWRLGHINLRIRALNLHFPSPFRLPILFGYNTSNWRIVSSICKLYTDWLAHVCMFTYLCVCACTYTTHTQLQLAKEIPKWSKCLINQFTIHCVFPMYVFNPESNSWKTIKSYTYFSNNHYEHMHKQIPTSASKAYFHINRISLLNIFLNLK